MKGFYSAPPFYKAYIKKLGEMKRDYPFLKLISAGRSVQGRKIYAICIGKMSHPTVFAAAFHASEWLTEGLMLRFCEELCQSIKCDCSLKRALEKRGVVILPCVNPDGVELFLTRGSSAAEYKRFTDKISGGDYSNWQANIRGVDLNHNFDAGHSKLIRMERAAGITGPSVRRFGGNKPLSEPETRSLAALCRNLKPSRVYAFHSQGEEIFYSYDGIVPTGAVQIARMLSEASGYELCEQSGLASHGGFKDWFIKEYSAPGFTIEIGRGKNPLPIGELSPIFARLYEAMLLALVV